MSNLNKVICDAKNPPMTDYGVFNNQYECMLMVPTKSVSLYEDADVWYNFGLIIGNELQTMSAVYDVNEEVEDEYSPDDLNYIMFYDKSLIDSMKINGVEHVDDIYGYGPGPGPEPLA